MYTICQKWAFWACVRDPFVQLVFRVFLISIRCKLFLKSVSKIGIQMQNLDVFCEFQINLCLFVTKAKSECVFIRNTKTQYRIWTYFEIREFGLKAPLPVGHTVEKYAIFCAFDKKNEYLRNINELLTKMCDFSWIDQLYFRLIHCHS